MNDSSSSCFLFCFMGNAGSLFFFFLYASVFYLHLWRHHTEATGRRIGKHDTGLFPFPPRSNCLGRPPFFGQKPRFGPNYGTFNWFVSFRFLFGYGFIRFWKYWVPKCCGVITLDQIRVLLGNLAGTVALFFMTLGFQSIGFGS